MNMTSNSTKCSTEYNIDKSFNETAFKEKFPKGGLISFNSTLEANGTYTLVICTRGWRYGQRKPLRKYRNGTEVEESDLRDEIEKKKKIAKKIAKEAAKRSEKAR